MSIVMYCKIILLKIQNGRIDGKGGLSSTTLKHHRNVINQILNLAVRNNIILQNPCQYVTMPKSERYNYDFLIYQKSMNYLTQ